MLSQFFNWRTTLSLVAVFIVTGTIFYSNYLAKKIEADERKKVNVWVTSLKIRSQTNNQDELNLTNIIANENNEIPIIGTDENDNPIGEYKNLDSNKVNADTNYLRKKVAAFKKQHECIKVEINNDPIIYNKYYYGDSKLLTEVRLYPIIQLLIVALFILVMFITISIRNKSTQNQVWAGMAKETAHQLGTPISSLKGWIEILKENHKEDATISEMSKDIERLNLISDRFSKIGSRPQLDLHHIDQQVEAMVQYIKKRSSEKVQFNIQSKHNMVLVPINAPLFDWVIENLLKNALDAIEGKGEISIAIEQDKSTTRIDIQDTGKGIAKKNITNVFKPGFSTKKRGWGLGLSLSKRIIEQYHKGQLYVKSSELGKGTTFRILLKNT